MKHTPVHRAIFERGLEMGHDYKEERFWAGSVSGNENWTAPYLLDSLVKN
jgi:hypothetical protein